MHFSAALRFSKVLGVRSRVFRKVVFMERCYGFSQCAVRCLTITPWDEKKEKSFYYTFLQAINMVLITMK